jgi:hypothetical protein
MAKSSRRVQHEAAVFTRPSKRKYPGEKEAEYLLAYLRQRRRFSAERAAFLKAFRAWGRVVQAKDIDALKRLGRRRILNPYYAITRMVGKRMVTVGVGADGLVVQPKSLMGKAAVAVFALSKHLRFDRIRQCIHCGEWFFARFKSQKFCNDPRKKCRWKHNHSPEWRKRNRERNKLYQRKYRKELFG